jgi:DNA-3-methyladenine glycosylase I
MSTDRPTRCSWAGEDPLMIRYHDREWGVPVHGERKLFEFLVLEGFQAGLSWRTILHKREAFRRAFSGFDPARVAAFDARRRRALLSDEGIVRNRAKVDAAITNARAVLQMRGQSEGLDGLLWSFVGGRPMRRAVSRIGDVPAESEESRAMSRELKRRQFRFVGPTICYAFMQATGMVNDHLASCFRRREIAG